MVLVVVLTKFTDCRWHHTHAVVFLMCVCSAGGLGYHIEQFELFIIPDKFES